MADNEIGEIQQKATAAIAAAIQAAGQIAQVLIEARIAQLQRAARQGEDQARQVRAQMRAAQRADATVWRAAYSRTWWRRAGAEDIARVWRAASAWAGVDPRAADARRVVADRLAERGVHINLAEGDRPGDARWLSDALDQAVQEQHAAGSELVLAGDVDAADASRDNPTGGTTPSRSNDLRDARAAAARRREQMAAHVRAAWPAERAERVITSEAWPVLAHKLDQLERQGHDVEALLRQVPSFVDRAHTPAAYAYRVVDDTAQDLADRERDQAGEDRAAERDERTLEGQWRAGDTDPPSVAATRADDAHAAADEHHVAADEHEVRAAQLAATAYPHDTKTAVGAAAAARASSSQVESTTPATAAQPVEPVAPAPEPGGR